MGHCFPAPEWNRLSKYGMASRHKRVRAFRAVAKNYLLHIQGRRSNKSRFVEPAEIVVFHFQPDPSARRPVKHAQCVKMPAASACCEAKLYFLL
jgi:hypothetical protein